VRIDFECSGGYAGLQLTYDVDTNELDPERATELETAVSDSGILESDWKPAAPPGSGPPDVMTYRVSVEDGGRTKRVTVTDITAPVELRPLLAVLRRYAARGG
jgi:hypothetical protein